METWKQIKLGKVLDYIQPSNYITRDINDNGNIPVLTANKSFVLGYTNENNDIYTELPAIIFDDFTTAIKYVDFPFKVRSSAIKILNNNSEETSLKFLYEFMITISFQSQEHKRYWISAYQHLKIPLPPLPEQQKIADILSTVDDKITVIDQQIAATEELKKGLMQRLLTKGIGHTEFKDSPLGEIPKSWEVVKQSEVATFFNGRAYKRKEWEKKGTPVIRLQNLTGSGKDFYYSNMSLPEHQYCYNGDLLYMWSATFGPVYWKGDKAIYHYHIWKIEHSEKLDKLFHFYLLDDVTRRMKNESHGSTMLHVTKGGMEKLPIQLPPIEEQKNISKVLSTVDAKLHTSLEKKQEYQHLKKGLMQQLLTGKIRVNNLIEA